jgi:hypothetical protein
MSDSVSRWRALIGVRTWLGMQLEGIVNDATEGTEDSIGRGGYVLGMLWEDIEKLQFAFPEVFGPDGPHEDCLAPLAEGC